MKKTLIKSGNPIVAKIISVGKKAIRKLANKAILLSWVKSWAILNVKRIFTIENIIGIISVEVSFIPKRFIDSDVRYKKDILKGKIG